MEVDNSGARGAVMGRAADAVVALSQFALAAALMPYPVLACLFLAAGVVRSPC